MPTYEYECRKCGHHFEILQSIKDDPLKKCPKPKCRGTVRRLLGTGVGIIFKGSGYYQTDYRSEDYKKKAKADATAAAAPSPDTSSKADASPKADASTKADTSTKTDTTTKVDATKTKKAEK